MRLSRNLGMLLLGVWLIAVGLSTFVPAIHGLGLIMAILAAGAGILILLGK